MSSIAGESTPKWKRRLKVVGSGLGVLLASSVVAAVTTNFLDGVSERNRFHRDQQSAASNEYILALSTFEDDYQSATDFLQHQSESQPLPSWATDPSDLVKQIDSDFKGVLRAKAGVDRLQGDHAPALKTAAKDAVDADGRRKGEIQDDLKAWVAKTSLTHTLTYAEGLLEMQRAREAFSNVPIQD